jgi:peptidoglycan/xylan/chitin deacetylase (PgdA/CDA1 family)
VFPVVLGICLDAEALWSNKIPAGSYRPVLMSHGAYAIHEGLEPLLDLLDRRGIRASFFAPGVTADRYPDALRRIRDSGHEIGSHGMHHTTPCDIGIEREREELIGGIDAVERATGIRPLTWRSPSWEISADTMQLLTEAGVEVSVNFQDRSRPYLHPATGGGRQIVELPVHWHLADAPYFLYGGLPGRVIRPATVAEQVWREEFDGLHDARPGTFFHLTLHVQLIGHPGRMRMLDRFLDHVQQRPRVRFVTCADLAHEVRLTQA